MKSLYKNIIGYTALGFICVGTFLTSYEIKNIKNKLTKFRIEWDSSINNMNESLTKTENSLDEIYKKVINVRISVSKLDGMIKGASIAKGYSSELEDKANLRED